MHRAVYRDLNQHTTCRLLVMTSVDAKHHGASLSEWWNVTWVGNNSIYTH